MLQVVPHLSTVFVCSSNGTFINGERIGGWGCVGGAEGGADT